MTNLIRFENLDSNLFFLCRKTAKTKARILTARDFEAREGMIDTLEGPAKFVPDDYLCVGAADEEWPVTKDNFEKTKQRISNPDADGWAFYINTNTVRAIQMSEDFQVQLASSSIVEGKAGGFLIDGGSSQWPCDEEIFNQTYERV